MLSRRNIRIKVLQALYAASMADHISPEELYQQYLLSCERTYKLMLYTLKLYIHTAAFALREEESRKTKLLVKEEDHLYEGILYRNELMQSMAENKFLKTEWAALKIPDAGDTDILRKIYHEFSKTEEYLSYWKDHKDHMQIMLALLKFCVGHALFQELLDEYNPAWNDDKSLVVGVLKRVIKALPADKAFFDEHRTDKALVEEFGQQLLLPVWNQRDELQRIIEPTLQNWDIKRVAILDLFMLKMAICEFQHFPTVPTKVTINEYVEIAKNYSTDKSREFINGILDRVMKDMVEKGLIQKTGRGTQE
jgi:N utilization substance protein B